MDAPLLSVARLREIADSLFDAPPSADDRRAGARLATSELVRVRPFAGEPFEAQVRDISREGVALVADVDLPAGEQFELKVPEAGELLATVRHVRAERGRFVIGARFGTDWLDTLAGVMQPPKVRSLSDEDARPRRKVESRVV